MRDGTAPLRGLGLAAALLAVAGCERPGAEPDAAIDDPLAGKRVGFAQIGAESGWRTAESRSIREEAERRGVQLVFADAQQRQENQIKALRSFVVQRVDAILLAPIVETGFEPVLREIQRAGIPVVLVDRGVDVEDDSLYATLIASDFLEEGRKAGEWLAERLGGEGNVVELQGTPGASAALDRKRGFEEALAAHPGLRIVQSQSGNFTRAGGKEVMEAFLKAARGEGRTIHAVYAHNDDMALGAIQAIEEAGLAPGKDLLLVSVDGVRDAFVAMQAGKLNCTVECNPLLGPAAFAALEKVLAGETLPRWQKVEDRVFDASVAAELLPTRQY